MPERVKFLTYAVGIFLCYFYFGIIQEKITRGRYGDEVTEDGVGERFTFALALVWVQCFCNWIFAKVLLLLRPQKEDTTHTDADKVGLGELLLFLSLSMDGLTGAIQERMRSSSAPSGQQMMLAMNWWSTIMLGVAILLTGEGKLFIAFALKHSELLVHLSSLALAGALGQFFIFLMVSHFGPLACSVVTTTRKFFTVLCSVLFFGNVLVPRQWFGAVLVFAGLFADMMFGKKSSSSAKKLPSSKHEEEKRKLVS
ncbi:unnamed protein product [Hermetia illucens]|uniref:Solute carrier family 35 member B1 n=1 Tax=Hermetia illucens TaxID=343691 RepID=A0A7R8Z254_HERIL|nr:unnamed protein product [Hermetia illucens]